MASSLHRRPARGGYTLLEMMIVVAMVLVLASLSWPALRRPLAKSKLLGAAKQLRAYLARSRLEAIRSGTAQQFRYQPGTGYFEVSAKSTSQGGGGFTPVAFEGLDEDEAAASESAYDEPEPSELPDGVRFCDPAVPDAPTVEPDLTALGDGGGWSLPIVFYPNGRTFNARIRLQGAYGYYVDVTLRGLTGSSKVGEVRRAEEPLGESPGARPEESP